MPSLITHIKESGLILSSFGVGNKDPVQVQIQKSHGVDAFMVMENSHGAETKSTTTTTSGCGGSVYIGSIPDVEEGVLRYQNGVDSGSFSL